MTRRPRRRRGRALLTAVAVLAGTAGLVGPVVTAPPAAAAEQAAEVLLDQLTPQVPQRGGVLTLGGRVVNRGTAPVDRPSVVLRAGIGPLGSREELHRPDADSRLGRVVAGGTRRLDVRLDPGKSATWSLQVPVAALGFQARGVYRIAVEARTSEARVGLVRTYLPWAPDKTGLVPTRAAMLWPLLDLPRLNADGVALDEGLPRALAPGGRLDRLTAAGTGLNVTWVVEPDLLLTAADLADGYEVVGKTGRTRGTGELVAAAWLQRMKAATAGGEVVSMPFADPDLVALQRNQLGRIVGDAMKEGRQDLVRLLGKPPRFDVAWPAGNQVDGPTLTTLGNAQIRSVVVDSASLPVADDLVYTPTGRATLPDPRRLDGLLADTEVSKVLAADATRPGNAVLLAQRFLAETQMITEDRPSDQRTVLFTPPRRWNPHPLVLQAVTTAMRGTPWLTPTTLTELRRTPPPTVRRGPLVYPPQARAAELGKPYLDYVAGVNRQLRLYLNILVAQDVVRRSYGPALLRAGSSGWRNSALGWGYTSNVRAGLGRLAGQVRILPRDNVTLASDSAMIPVTVVNGSKQEVEVRLRVTSKVSQRLSIGPVGTRRIKPEQRVTFNVPARASANGVVLVTTQIETKNGQPYGPELVVKVRATNYGGVGLLAVGGATGLLFLVVLVRLVRRGRRAVVGQREREPGKVGV